MEIAHTLGVNAAKRLVASGVIDEVDGHYVAVRQMVTSAPPDRSVVDPSLAYESACGPSVEREASGTDGEAKDGRQGGMAIATAIVRALASAPAGLSRADVIVKASEAAGRALNSISVGGQLSRLQAVGQAKSEDGLWRLVQHS